MEHGYASIFVNNIVETTGVTKGGFYHYFKSKGDIFLELLKRYISIYIEDFNLDAFNALPDVKTKPYSIFQSICTAIEQIEIDTGSMNPKVTFLFVCSAPKKFDFLDERIAKAYEKMASIVRAIFRKGIRECSIRKDIKTNTAAYQTIAMLEGMILLYMLNTGVDIKKRKRTEHTVRPFLTGSVE